MRGKGGCAPLFLSHKCESRRRAVSEIMATLLMVIITIAGFGVYYGVLRSNLGLSSSTLTEQFQKGARVAGQQIDLSYWTVNGTTLSLFVYNYGFSNLTLKRIVVGGANTEVTTASVTVLPSGSTTLLPSGRIPVKQLVKISFTSPSLPPALFLVTLVTTDGKIFQWRI